LAAFTPGTGKGISLGCGTEAARILAKQLVDTALPVECRKKRSTKECQHLAAALERNKRAKVARPGTRRASGAGAVGFV
jgi:hypothetical protein